MSEENVTESTVESTEEGFEESQDVESSESESSEESAEELQEEIEEAIENGASEAEVKQMIKEFELKVNGKSVKAKIDLSDEEAVKRELQKAYAFNEVSQEQAQMKKQLQQVFSQWKQNPEQALRDLGIDPDEWAEMTLSKKVEEMKKSPEQIEKEKLQRELEQYRQREIQAKKKMEELELQKQSEQAYQQLEQEIAEAFQDHPNLKHNTYTQRRVAELMSYYHPQYPDITARDVLPILEKELQKEISTILEGVPDKFIEQLVGKQTVDRLTSKFKPKAAKKKPLTTSQVKQATTLKKDIQQQNPTKKLTFEEMMSKRF